MAAPDELEMHVLVNALPALTASVAVFTVAVTEAFDEHPVAVVVFVTVYVVVEVGFANGLLTVVELNPAEGVQT